MSNIRKRRYNRTLTQKEFVFFYRLWLYLKETYTVFKIADYENFFDTIFTSPPYFNTEKYSLHDTQSYLRYKKIDDWNTNFLHKTIDKLIVCKNCGWSWKESQSSKEDLYICHKCGFDNEPY